MGSDASIGGRQLMRGTTRKLQNPANPFSRVQNRGNPRPEQAVDDPVLNEVVEYVLSDCFFAVGQTIGMRATVDYDAVVWWHDHFRGKFLAAMQRHGNRWAEDREAVTAVGWMLGERAVRHAACRNSIDLEAARRAAADVERYCRHRSKRRAQANDGNADGATRVAGFWCLPIPC